MSAMQKAVERAKELVGQGYIYGAKGQTCTPAFRRQQAAQYPDQASNILGTGAKWDGKPVWDCAQLTRTVAKAGGVTLVSGATSQWTKTKWADKGTIDTIPAMEPVFLYRRQNGSATVMAHTGFALGDGTCVHARGTAYGVVRQDMAQYAWTHWARPAWANSGGNSGDNNDSQGGESMETLYKAAVTADSGSTVNVRVEPGINSARQDMDSDTPGIDPVAVGETVEVLKEVDTDWAMIRYNGVQGYMMRKFLRKENGGAADVSGDQVTLTLSRALAESLYKALDAAVAVG